jgi:hypothetical protein
LCKLEMFMKLVHPIGKHPICIILAKKLWKFSKAHR